MFSFFDYLRRRTCDSVLAGMHDAFELIETRNADETTKTAESLLEKFDGGSEAKPIAAVPAPAPRPVSPPPPPNLPALQSPSHPDNGESLQPRKRGRPPKMPGGPQ